MGIHRSSPCTLNSNPTGVLALIHTLDAEATRRVILCFKLERSSEVRPIAYDDI